MEEVGEPIPIKHIKNILYICIIFSRVMQCLMDHPSDEADRKMPSGFTQMNPLKRGMGPERCELKELLLFELFAVIGY
jgi:hypothetical protein